MRLYVLDVGVYARAPLLSGLARLVADGCCVVTSTVLHVFHHRLVGSIEYFVERYDDIKQSLRVLFPRHSRRLNALRSLKLLEAKRQGRQDAMLYTVLRAVLAIPPERRSVGALLEDLLTQLDHARHPMELLDMLRFWLGASKLKGLSSSLASSIEHTLNSYLEAMIGCRVGHGSGYEEAIRDATRIARQLRVKDREDVAMLLSACSLAQGGTEGPSDVVVLTADRGVGALLERLRGYDACFTGVTVRLVA